jgi:hypothetical protein
MRAGQRIAHARPHQRTRENAGCGGRDERKSAECGDPLAIEQRVRAAMAEHPPAENEGARDRAVEEVVVVTQNHQKEHDGRADATRNRGLGHEFQPQQHEERDPLE